MSIVLGIDVGATGIKGNLVDTKEGVCLAGRLKIPTPAESTPENVLEVVQRIIAHFNWQGKAVGMGFPSVVANGQTLTAANIHKDWIGFQAQDFFYKHLQCPFAIINDADAAGYAEVEYGVGKNVSGKLLLLTLGTGIGSALFYQKNLIPNTEFGHLKWKDSVAEKYASNSARKKKDLTYEQWAIELDQVLAHIDFLMSPELIILGGGVSKRFDEYQQYLQSPKCPVVKAAMQNDAGIVGAGLFALTVL